MEELGDYDKSMQYTHRDYLVEATEEELKSLHKNGIYELERLLKDKKALTNKRILRLKQ